MIPNHSDSVSITTKTATKTHHSHPPWPGVEFSGTRCEVWTRRGAFASFLGCAGDQNHQSDVVLDQRPWYPRYPQIAGEKGYYPPNHLIHLVISWVTCFDQGPKASRPPSPWRTFNAGATSPPSSKPWMVAWTDAVKAKIWGDMENQPRWWYHGDILLMIINGLQ